MTDTKTLFVLDEGELATAAVYAGAYPEERIEIIMNSGARVVEMIEKLKPHQVISGYEEVYNIEELAAAVKKADIPLVVVTGNDSREIEDEIRNLGGKWFKKGSPQKELFEMVNPGREEIQGRRKE